MRDVDRQQLRLLIAGGGTGGHVLPAIAVFEELQRRHMIESALWLGSHDGLESSAAAQAGIAYAAIQTGKLRRYFSLATATDAARIPIGMAQARRHIHRFRPTVVLSTGGFVSVPTAIAARNRAPILTHEQTAILGLATRINARVADAVAVSFAPTVDSAKAIHRRVVLTGNPVRASLHEGDARRLKQRWNIADSLPLVLITGGARGASPVSQRIEALLPALLEHVQILHQTGPDSVNGDASRLQCLRSGWAPRLQARYHVVEFIREELGDVYARADLVVGRAGAGTVAELAALGQPAILIPLPGAGGDEQTRNAGMLADAGGALLIPQAEATPERLQAEILALVTDADRLAAMSTAAQRVGRRDAAQRLADVLVALHSGTPVAGE